MAAKPVVLVDAADIGADDEIVVSIEVGLHLHRLAAGEFEFDGAAPIVGVAIGLGEERRPVGDGIDTARIGNDAER